MSEEEREGGREGGEREGRGRGREGGKRVGGRGEGGERERESEYLVFCMYTVHVQSNLLLWTL